VTPQFAGDRALAALLFHGLAMNRGFLHAIECMQPGEVDPYADGDDDEYESLDASLWERYTSAMPDDDALSARFKRHFLRRRSDFAPL
jgi:hypothetical protein